MVEITDNIQFVSATYQGISLQNASYSRTAGLDPDRGRLEILNNLPKGEKLNLIPEVGPPKPGAKVVNTVALPPEGDVEIKAGTFKIVGDLIFNFGVNKKTSEGFANLTLTIPNLFVGESGIKEIITHDSNAPEDQRNVRLMIDVVDERIFWQTQGNVFGKYNFITKENGLNIDGELYDPDTLKDGEKLWTLVELIIICVKALPKPAISRLVFEMKRALNKKPIGIDWGSGKLAAAALNELMSQHSVWVSFTLARELIFYDYGQVGKNPPDRLEGGQFFKQKLRNVNYNFKPNVVEVVGERIIKQSLINDWVLVTQWDVNDGEFCKGDILPLRFAIDRWGLDFELVRKATLSMSKKYSAAWKFVEEVLGEVRGKKVGSILAKTSFQWFRIGDAYRPLLPMTDVRPLEIIGRAKRNECARKEEFAIEVIGSIFEPADESDLDDLNGNWENKINSDLTKYLIDIDLKKGVLKFSRPLGVLRVDEESVFLERTKIINGTWETVLNEIQILVLESSLGITDELAGIPGPKSLESLENERDRLVGLRKAFQDQVDETPRAVMVNKFKFQFVLDNGDTIQDFSFLFGFELQEIPAEELAGFGPLIRAEERLRTLGKQVESVFDSIKNAKQANKQIKQDSIDVLVQKLRRIAFEDDRLRNEAVLQLELLGTSGDFVNLGECTLLPTTYLSVIFAHEMNRNRKDDHYRFNFILDKKDKFGAEFQIKNKSLIQFIDINGISNKKALDKKAAVLVNKIYDSPDVFQDHNWEFYGPQVVETSGAVMQVAWDFSISPPMILTRVLSRDPFHGIDHRPGVVTRQKRIFNRSDLINLPHSARQDHIGQ